MRQLIIVRKDLNMSTGKIAAQVAHASMMFVKYMLSAGDFLEYDSEDEYLMQVLIRKDIWHNWFNDIYTKTICEAKNKNHLLKVIDAAKELGLEENRDYFLVKDHCLTELEPEEIDEDGIGKVLTCIGFRPLADEISKTLSKKYQLFH